MAYKVFISANPGDADLAEDLAQRLGKGGVSVTQAEDHPDLETLRTSDEIIALVTEKSLRDDWMLFAMGAASSLRKPLTQIVVGMDQRPLPQILREIPHVRYRDVERFLAAVQARAGDHSRPPRAAAR